MPKNEITEKELAQQILTNVDTMGKSVSQVVEEVKALSATVEGLEKLDIPTFINEFEKLRASHENIAKQIQNNKSGLFIPGLEDEKKQFSLLRAMRSEEHTSELQSH